MLNEPVLVDLTVGGGIADGTEGGELLPLSCAELLVGMGSHGDDLLSASCVLVGPTELIAKILIIIIISYE